MNKNLFLFGIGCLFFLKGFADTPVYCPPQVVCQSGQCVSASEDFVYAQGQGPVVNGLYIFQEALPSQLSVNHKNYANCIYTSQERSFTNQAWVYLSAKNSYVVEPYQPYNANSWRLLFKNRWECADFSYDPTNCPFVFK